MSRNTGFYAMIFGSLVCFSAHADQWTENTETCCREETCLMKPTILYETRDTSGTTFGVRGDILYMNYSYPEVTFASEQVITASDVSSHILAAKSKAEVGFDVGINYTMEGCSEYTFELGWFYINPKWSRNVTSEILLPAHIETVNQVAPGIGTNNAKLDMNFIDLTMSKAFSFGKYFALSPTVGVVGGFMTGTNTAAFQASSGSFNSRVSLTQVATKQHVSFNGVGVKIGTGYGFNIWENFGIIGDISVNMLYGFTKVKLDITENTPTGTFPQTGSVAYKQHNGCVFLDSLVGLYWKWQSDNNASMWDLHAGWRVQSFYPGWIHIQAEGNNAMTERSLFGQGLEAGITFKF